MSTTLKQLLEDFCEEFGQGTLGVTTATGDTTSLIDATRQKRPVAGNQFPRNAPIRITGRAAVGGGGITIGSEVFLDDYDPSAGDFTVTPAMNDTPEIGTSFIAAYGGGADSTERWVEALNRFLTRVARYRDKVPLTQGSYALTLMGATSDWSTTNATLSYVTGSPLDPHWARYLHVVATANNGYANAVISGVVAGDVHDFYIPAVEPYLDTGVARVRFFDVYDGTEITPTFTTSDGTLSGATEGVLYMPVRGYFTVPPGTSGAIEVRYQVTVSGESADFGPLFIARRGSRTYVVPREIETIQQLGQLYTIDQLGAGTVVSSMTEQLVPIDIGYSIAQRGFANVLQFQEEPPFPLLIEADVHYPALATGDPTSAAAGSAASESDTTNCPKALALAGMAVEFFRHMHRDERLKRGPDSAQTRWGGLLADAERALVTAQADYNAPRTITTVRRFAGRASA